MRDDDGIDATYASVLTLVIREDGVSLRETTRLAREHVAIQLPRPS